jgi:glutaminase
MLLTPIKPTSSMLLTPIKPIFYLTCGVGEEVGGFVARVGVAHAGVGGA